MQQLKPEWMRIQFSTKGKAKKGDGSRGKGRGKGKGCGKGKVTRQGGGTSRAKTTAKTEVEKDDLTNLLSLWKL